MEEQLISDVLTVQSLANFGAMTGAIAAAWNALIRLNTDLFAQIWVPFVFAGAFAVVSLLISLDALKKNGKWQIGAVAASIFIGVINALILASAVIGTGIGIEGELSRTASGP